MIGGGTRIDDKASVVGSVVGSDSTIGKSTVVSNSFLWEGASIGAGCSVESSILADGVTLLDGTHVERGCLIGEGVTLGPNVTLPAFSRVSRERPADEESDDELVSSREPSKIGAKGSGWLWPVDPEQDDPLEELDETGEERELSFETPQNLKYLRIGREHDFTSLA